MKIRSGLTLLELVVVLMILAALAALVIPRLSGISDVTNSAVNSSTAADMNRIVATYESRFGKSPATWDGIVSGGTLYSKLHPDLSSKLSVLTLTAIQAESLTSAGVQGLMVVDPAYTGSPSDSARTAYSPIATGLQIAKITKEPWAGHGSTFLDRAFNVLPSFGPTGPVENPNEYVVLGVGLSSSLRGSQLHDAPIVPAADPTQYYARVLCVYKVPPTSSTTGFKAQFVGAFLPDGTCINDNVNKFHESSKNVN